MGLLTRIVKSEVTVKLHSEVLSLLRVLSPFERQQSIEQIVALCLKSAGTKSTPELTSLRLEAINLSKTMDHRVYLLTKDLLEGLVDCLSDSDVGVKMETLKLIQSKLVPFSDALFTGQMTLEGFSEEPVLPRLVERLLEILDDPSQEVRLMATGPLLVLAKSLPGTPDDSQLLM